jgi:uncharacterized membrane protein YqiK
VRWQRSPRVRSRQARADAEQNVIQQEAEGRAQAARIRAVAEAEAIRKKAPSLVEAGGAYFDLRRLAPGEDQPEQDARRGHAPRVV